ncbi:MAG: hypothetical protein ABEJ68_10180 [Halobacteriaceae archaeon]
MSDDATGASEVVLSYSPTDDRTKAELDSDSYRAYLRRTRSGRVSSGEERAEFVSDGCGRTHEVTLRVESVRGGDTIGTETAFVFEAADG